LASTLDARLSLAGPEAVAVPLPRFEVRTVGCLFPAGAAALGEMNTPGATVSLPRLSAATNRPPRERILPLNLATRTRIRPPRDVVKLEDRLYFLLQPPLEQVFASESLTFPCRPFPYQFDGIAFLYPRHEAVLADEMGLGKTMQAVVALRLLAHQGHVRRALLVCPKPLVTNWQREIAHWAPELLVTVVEGTQSRRQWLWQNAHHGVLLANYEALVRDRQQFEALERPFDLMIIDESQRIKNRLSTTNEVVCSAPRLRSWALTGTPIENSVEDLVGIFQFVSPGCLSPQMKTPAIRRSVSDYVLRRTKDQVLTDLPPKLFRDADVALTPEQRESYELAETEGVVRLKEMKAELTIQHVFELVLRLKQICNFDPVTGASSKLDRLEADLEECAASGRKAIVFSQWVQTIEELSRRLERFHPLEYHGKIPSKRRDGVIETFRNEPARHVLLMSYGAGSVGLNLQFASYVFLFDRWWNPAVEDQAINRAHRIGAAGPVTVTRFLVEGTIEERINKVLEEKRELFNSVFDPTTSSEHRLGLSREDIFGLFKLQFPAEGS
jgi:SNF2 family DNA or RNA helicase